MPQDRHDVEENDSPGQALIQAALEGDDTKIREILDPIKANGGVKASSLAYQNLLGAVAATQDDPCLRSLFQAKSEADVRLLKLAILEVDKTIIATNPQFPYELIVVIIEYLSSKSILNDELDEILERPSRQRLWGLINVPDGGTQDEEEGLSFLHTAAREGQNSLIEEYALMGFNVNKTNAQGETPLMMATAKNRVSTVRLLLNLNANPSLTDSMDESASDKTINKAILEMLFAQERILSQQRYIKNDCKRQKI